MILISVGSTLFPFQRMTTLVEHLTHNLPKRERVIFQYGYTPPHFLDRRVIAYPFLPHTTLLRHIRDARVVICHGGPATIYQALSYGKIPWVLPRESRYGEHLNDHQAEFAQFLSSHGLIRIITPQTGIRDIVTGSEPTRPIMKRNRPLIRFLDTLVNADGSRVPPARESR